MVNVGLEGRGGVGQAKGYDEILKVPVSSTKGSLLLVSFPYPNSIIYILQVDLRKDDRTVQAIKKFANQQERVSVLDSNSIKASVVNTEV